jgi:hypothetical protein
MTNVSKRDFRPEGGILLEASLWGAWWQATHIGCHALAAGYDVKSVALERPGMIGIKFQTITATKGE